MVNAKWYGKIQKKNLDTYDYDQNFTIDNFGIKTRSN